jgi:acyl-CoA synthetase (AMP-forming)/AMP-acid ligase II
VPPSPLLALARGAGTHLGALTAVLAPRADAGARSRHPIGDRLGERLVAVVVPTDGFDAAEFLRWARDQVAGYRRPTEVVTVDAIPRVGNGKLDRDGATRLAAEALVTGGGS